MSKIIFIIGGCKSGKSNFAQKLSLEIESNQRIYLATGVVTDKEMDRRVKRHREQRKGLFETVECPYDLIEEIEKRQKEGTLLLVDCLTMWINNLLFKGYSFEEIEKKIENFVDRINNARGTIVLVSNEVGLGIVPDNELSRQFRDLAGMFHQKVASVAHQVYFVVCGIPTLIKG